MEEKKTITIHNKVSSNFTEIHVDGAFGGFTPRGLINLNFYAERTPIPKSAEFLITEKGLGQSLGNSEDSKEGILREYQFGIYMDVTVANSIIQLLNTQIAEYNRLQQATKPQTNS